LYLLKGGTEMPLASPPPIALTSLKIRDFRRSLWNDSAVKFLIGGGRDGVKAILSGRWGVLQPGEHVGENLERASCSRIAENPVETVALGPRGLYSRQVYRRFWARRRIEHSANIGNRHVEAHWLES